MQKNILSILVENHPGVLSKVSGLFARRGFNIDSLAVGETDNHDTSRITIVVNGDDYVVDQVTKQLNKLIDVIKIKNLSECNSVSRELILTKVSCTASSRQEIIQIVDIFRGKIIDVSKESVTIEATGTEDKIAALLDMVKPFGIIEIARTGMVSLERGNTGITV